ncbi:hypothetical protein FNO01nite_13780 [Flavobacterium noncentrifugens]|uniref:Acetyltransferase (GNAT) domain-containing protein n=1 Tax=Flavobacterium noncentrifugens TaxID=1128970 RepID=A0A1G8VZD1_9FLAO|nr:GNAT family N-acetyltransferase [Flavobacterium noncentrifugens]GEP50706.1 hypothetical protein FNO01nite_13780 [Flavobacterium noncentrifugens]SDJ71412.1 Acetyltransferase (GNAT) domain-containing protein [Flavobacterium noncentrifugens]
MKNYTVRTYEPSDHTQWNAFVSKAKNATFLFYRDFMEYHSDRFSDFSMLVFEGEKLISILPANRSEDAVFSHQGLTYGGFVFDENIKLGKVLEVCRAVLFFLDQNKISLLQIKMIPEMYNSMLSEDIKYAFFLTDSKLIRRDCLAVIDLSKPFSATKSRRQSIRHGAANGLEIREEAEFDFFWNDVLIPNLHKKHQSKPVHTLEEIKKLQQLFPQNIRHFNVYHKGNIVAGTTLFITENVVHPQYISADAQKNELESLDYLYDYLISEISKGKNYFDFGPSHEQNGKKINNGILFWKESFGAKITVQDFYEINTSRFSTLDNILI